MRKGIHLHSMHLAKPRGRKWILTVGGKAGLLGKRLFPVRFGQSCASPIFALSSTNQTSRIAITSNCRAGIPFPSALA